jgi:hypothetical protein
VDPGPTDSAASGCLGILAIYKVIPILRTGSSPVLPPGGTGTRCYARDVPDLVLLRHGQSTWNAENLFTGWIDVDLTAAGEAEALKAGRLLAGERDLDLRVAHT